MISSEAVVELLNLMLELNDGKVKWNIKNNSSECIFWYSSCKLARGLCLERKNPTELSRQANKTCFLIFGVLSAESNQTENSNITCFESWKFSISSYFLSWQQCAWRAVKWRIVGIHEEFARLPLSCSRLRKTLPLMQWKFSVSDMKERRRGKDRKGILWKFRGTTQVIH